MDKLPLQRDIMYDDPIDLRVECKSIIREIKLGLLNNEYQFRIIEDRSKFSKMLDLISNTVSKKFPNIIITGTLALKLYDLYSYNTENDITVIVDELYHFKQHSNGIYGDFLATLNFQYKKNMFNIAKFYSVNFYLNDKVSYEEFIYNGKKIKVQIPIEIIQYKYNMDNYSNRMDIIDIFQNAKKYKL